MATLLTMVNDLRVMLREERVTIISDTDELTQVLVSLINRAVCDVLESRVWSFDKRDDGVALFRGLLTGTDVAVISENPVFIESSADAIAFFSSNTLGVRFRVTDDTAHPGLSYSANTAVVAGPTLGLNVTPVWSGETPIASSTSTWELYATDTMLPVTVRKVMSVRDEEQPIQLYFTEDEIFLDRAWPRATDTTGDPEAVVIGGTMTTSFQTLVHDTGETGMRMRVFPVPTSDSIIYYRYVYRHAAMEDAEDTLTGVPDHFISLISDKAFHYCLIGNVEADPTRAAQVIRQYRIDLELAGRQDRTAPNRRRVMRPIGSRFLGPANRRWESKEVPIP